MRACMRAYMRAYMRTHKITCISIFTLIKITCVRCVSMNHAVIIDAGSSGSRAFVYAWPDPQNYLLDLTTGVFKHALLPVNADPKRVARVEPGVASFAKKQHKLWEDHLERLLKPALQLIPVEKHAETPVFFLATAGMRLLPQKEQTSLLRTVCRHLQTKTQFLVPECDSHVQIISGETEGLYGWLGLNYLVHHAVEKRWDSFTDTYGFLDMGGASAQLAFAADQELSAENEIGLHDLRIRTAGGSSVSWRVFVNTWLGYGANQAHQRMRQRILSETLESSSDDTDDEDIDDIEGIAVAIDPCLPKGAVDKVVLNDMNVEFHGSGDFAACEAITTQLISKSTCEPGSACLFDDIAVSESLLRGHKFVGISEYWYTLQDLFQTNGKYEYSVLEPKINEFCSSSWSEIETKLMNNELLKGGTTAFKERELKQACFKSAWVLTVLKKGLNFDLSSETPSLDHEFKDKFQSAAHIGGTEVSWTLGRAVLYASSQIPENPTDLAPLEPGFVTPSGEFITGGELLSVVEIKHLKTVEMYSYLGFTLFYFFVCVFGLVAAFLYLRHTSIAHSVNRAVSKLLRVFRNRRKTRSHRRTASSIGYGMSYPHADVPFQLDELHSGISSSHPPTRAPSRVGSRIFP